MCTDWNFPGPQPLVHGFKTAVKPRMEKRFPGPAVLHQNDPDVVIPLIFHQKAAGFIQETDRVFFADDELIDIADGRQDTVPVVQDFLQFCAAAIQAGQHDARKHGNRYVNEAHEDLVRTCPMHRDTPEGLPLVRKGDVMHKGVQHPKQQSEKRGAGTDGRGVTLGRAKGQTEEATNGAQAECHISRRQQDVGRHHVLDRHRLQPGRTYVVPGNFGVPGRRIQRHQPSKHHQKAQLNDDAKRNLHSERGNIPGMAFDPALGTPAVPDDP